MERVIVENVNTPEYWDEMHRVHSSGWDAAPAVCETILRLGIPCGASVMDVGVGSAHVLASIYKLREDLQLYGCDFSEVAVARLMGHSVFKGGHVMDVMRPMVGWGIPPLRWDLVISTETLEHVEDPKRMIEVLVRGARLWVIVTTPNENRVNSKEHLWSISQQDLESMLSKYGRVEVCKIIDDHLLLGVLWL